MTYEYKIRPTYPNKYNTQQKTNYHISIPKYNTPNQRMIYKYKIQPLYPKKYNTQQKTTYHYSHQNTELQTTVYTNTKYVPHTQQNTNYNKKY